MNWLVFHVASGQSFFSGVALVVFATLLSARSGLIAKRLTSVAFLMGVIAIAISSTPLPYWYYGLAGLITMGWLVSVYVARWQCCSQIAVIATWSVAIAMEVPFQFTPTLEPVSTRSMTIVGDSITAGMGMIERSSSRIAPRSEDALQSEPLQSNRSVRWPTLFAAEHHIRVQDLSQPGATTATALKTVQAQPITAPVVVLEIGGNDVLGDTTSEEYARDLEALLSQLAVPGRQLIMFELPLPPFRNEFGRIQRTLARKHNVALVPKRVLLSAIAADDSTVDSIHLTPTGHQRMAKLVWSFVQSAFP